MKGNNFVVFKSVCSVWKSDSVKNGFEVWISLFVESLRLIFELISQYYYLVKF